MSEPTTNTAAGRRRSRFSLGLRGLMLLVLAFAVFLGWRVNRANTQHRTVAAIVAVGGHVCYDWHSDPGGRWVPGWLRKRIERGVFSGSRRRLFQYLG